MASSSRKALEEIRVGINRNETDSYINSKQLYCADLKRNELRIRPVSVQNGARNEPETRRRANQRKENEEKCVSKCQEFKEPSVASSRTKVQITNAVTSTPLASVSKSALRNDTRVPEFHLSPIADQTVTNRIVSPSTSSLARTKGRLLREELTADDRQKTSNVFKDVELSGTDEEEEEQAKKENEVFCSTQLKSYSRTPKASKRVPKSCTTVLRAKWSDDDSDTIFEDVDDDDDKECGFLCVANSKPALLRSLDASGYETTSENLVSRKQTKKKITKKKKKQKLNDPNAHLIEQMRKEFEEVDKTVLCFV